MTSANPSGKRWFEANINTEKHAESTKNLNLTHFKQMFFSKTVVRRCSVKNVFLKIPENPQENTCARVSFLMKLGRFQSAILFKKRLWHTCIPVNFAKFLSTHFYAEHFWWLFLSL